MYLLYYLCIVVFTFDAGPLAKSQYSERPATGHPETGFSWFPFVYKQMLRWFPRFQVATTCFSCSPPDLNLLITNFIFSIHVKWVTTQLSLIHIIIKTSFLVLGGGLNSVSDFNGGIKTEGTWSLTG